MELNIDNFKRINRINWIICGPILFMFSWPYIELGHFFSMNPGLTLIGSFFFSVPFTLTILHGHISIAVGPLHSARYYEWQQNKTGIFKLMFHPVLFGTRVRVMLIVLSAVLFTAGHLM